MVNIGLCNTLAISNFNLYGYNTKANNHLHWKLSDSADIKKFVIERSENAVRFSQIGTKDNSVPAMWSFTDKDVIPGETYFYRIKAVATNGNTTYSNITKIASLKEAVRKFDGLVFPNPAMNVLQLQVLDSKFTGNTFTIYDIQNKEIYRGTLDKKKLLNVASFTSGYYIIRIINQDGVVVKPFIISR